MANRVDNFLGDTLGRTIIKLVIISLIVGVILAAINVTPWEVWETIQRFFISLYNLGYDALWRIGSYFLYGAVIVVPIFLVLRFLKFGR